MRKLLIVGTAFLLAIALGVGTSLAQKAHTPRIEARQDSRCGEISFQR